jgi:large subunit ribosomal protein L28
MAQVCKICGKGPQFGNKISHAHNVSKRRWNVNLRPVKAEVDGGSKRIRVCTRCIKAGKVVKAWEPALRLSSAGTSGATSAAAGNLIPSPRHVWDQIQATKN